MRSACLLALAIAMSVSAADLDSLVKRVKAVGPEGVGNADAAVAWKELSRLDGNAIVPLLKAFDGASGVAGNYLRSALDAIVERNRDAKSPMPVDALKTLLADRNRDARARRISYELLLVADPKTKDMLPSFLDDPCLELRFDAVQSGFETAKKSPKDNADTKAALRKLLTASRDKDQAEAIVKELEERGDKVDVVAHFNFLKHWFVAGPFDNADEKGYAKRYTPESGVDLKATYTGKGGRTFGWKPVSADPKTGIVDLNLVYPHAEKKNTPKQTFGEKHVVAFGYTEFTSPEARPAELRAASATALVLYLNGERVFGREAYHQSFDTDSYIAPVKLKKGTNRLLFKVVQDDGQQPWMQNWQFLMRVTDSLGTPLPVTPVSPEAFGKEKP